MTSQGHSHSERGTLHSYIRRIPCVKHGSCHRNAEIYLTTLSTQPRSNPHGSGTQWRMLTRTLTACSRSSTKSKMTPRFLHTFEQSQNSNSRSCNHVMLCVGVVLSNLSYQLLPYIGPTEFNHKIILFLTLLFLYFFLYPKQINGNNKQASFPVRRGPRRGPG